MSNKNKSTVNINNVKYFDNSAINFYARADSKMSKSLEPIKKILLEEHCKDNLTFFTDEIALNLDKVEIERKKGSSYRDKTIDFVVGLENGSLLLVEAKFDTKNVVNIVSDFKKKLSHSKNILSGNINFKSFYKKEVILLSQTDFHQNYRKLRTLLIGKNLITTEPQKIIDFYNDFFNNDKANNIKACK